MKLKNKEEFLVAFSDLLNEDNFICKHEIITF